jgi:hypothetical protein
MNKLLKAASPPHCCRLGAAMAEVVVVVNPKAAERLDDEGPGRPVLPR